MTTKTRWPLALALATLLLATTFPTQAHQQWLFPNFFTQSADSAWLSFDHTSGDQRFYATSAPNLYYQYWVVSPAQQARTIPSLFAGKTKIVGEVELTEPGTYRIEGVEPSLVWTKLKEEESETWQPGPRSKYEGQEILESKVYFIKALAYVSLGPVSPLPQKPIGDPLEIAFRAHPNELKANQKLEVRLLSFGKPVADQTLQLFSGGTAGHDPMLICTTDADGWCEFLPEKSGRYLLLARLEGPTPEDPEIDGFSYRVSLALEINP
ncbi:MAG: DUF4198 domain-containing protein [Acidobacteriota bacterium]